MELTQQYLKSILNYDKDTGIFTWKNCSAKHIKIGQIAGSKNIYGYIAIGIYTNGINKLFRAHRLAWLYVHGNIPKKYIDHINHIRNDNRISNLREVDISANQKNMSKSKANSSGVTGVVLDTRQGKWLALIGVKGKLIRIGIYEDKNEAICARLHANKLYGFHQNHGK